MKESKLKIYLYFLLQFRKKLVQFLFFSFSLSVVQMLLIAVLYPFVSYSLGPGADQGNAGFILEKIKNIALHCPVDDPLIAASILLIVLGVLQGVFRYLSVSSSLDLSYSIIYSLQQRMYERVMNSDISYFIHKKQGDILFTLKDPPIKVGYVVRGSAIFVRELLTAIFLLIMMGSINYKLTLIVLVIGGLFGVFIKMFTKRIIYRTGVASTKALGEEDIVLNESLSGAYTIKAFLAEKKWIQTFVQKVSDYVRVTKKMNVLKEIPLASLEAVIIVLIAVSAIVFKILYAQSFGAFMPVFSVFAVSILKMIPSIRNLSNAGMNVVSMFYNLEICHDMLHKDTSMIKNGEQKFSRFDEGIRFKNIDFTYPGYHQPVFKGLSLSFKKNKITVIAGRSGSGKTTLINLLLRFYDPQVGHIEIDQTNLKDIDRESFLQKIGYVSQEPFIFHATIAENISFGGDYSQRDIEEAAKLSEAHTFIMKFKDQYQTMVGEKGMRLSGGEKQRIAIARALLRKPQILIFDEATSALDAMTEKFIQDTIQKLAHHYTIIIIAHRFSTFKMADNILVLDSGALVEEGTHEDLLRIKSHYSQLHTL